jgi:DNA invertase Pin-like site-specific DNA recombinase
MKAEGKNRAGGKKPSGRPEDAERNARQQLRDGVSWSTIQKAEDCSRSTIFKVHQRTTAPSLA